MEISPHKQFQILSPQTSHFCVNSLYAVFKILVRSITMLIFSDLSLGWWTVAVRKQCCCFSLVLSLSAQVCPSHMTSNHSLWNWICRTAAIILTESETTSSWWRKRNLCSLSVKHMALCLFLWTAIIYSVKTVKVAGHHLSGLLWEAQQMWPNLHMQNFFPICEKSSFQ